MKISVPLNMNLIEKNLRDLIDRYMQIYEAADPEYGDARLVNFYVIFDALGINDTKLRNDYRTASKEDTNAHSIK